MTAKLSTAELKAMLAGITPDWREEDGTVYGPDPHMDGEVMICSTTLDPTDGLTEYDAHNARAIAQLPALLAEVIALREALGKVCLELHDEAVNGHLLVEQAITREEIGQVYEIARVALEGTK